MRAPSPATHAFQSMHAAAGMEASASTCYAADGYLPPPTHTRQVHCGGHCVQRAGGEAAGWPAAKLRGGRQQCLFLQTHCINASYYWQRPAYCPPAQGGDPRVVLSPLPGQFRERLARVVRCASKRTTSCLNAHSASHCQLIHKLPPALALPCLQPPCAGFVPACHARHVRAVWMRPAHPHHPTGPRSRRRRTSLIPPPHRHTIVDGR